MAEIERVDTTYMGFFLIGLLLFVLGIIGLQDGGIFGEPVFDSSKIEKSTLPLDYALVITVCFIISVALMLLSVFAYRTGKKHYTALFSLTSTSLFIYGFLSVAHKTFVTSFIGDKYVSSSWFMLIAFAIFFIILGAYLLMDKAPKMVACTALLIAVVFIFMGLAYYFWFANGIDIVCNETKTMGMLFGIFGLIGCALSTYVGFAMMTPRAKLPIL